MKRFILFMIAVFVIMFGFNFDVKALVNDVSIKDVEVVNMTGKPDVIKEPTYKDLAIDLGVRFFDVGDSVTYRITVENKGTSDVYINDVIGNTNSEYFDYTFGFENDDKTVKGKSNKTFNLTVSFKNDIPDEKFSESGKVVEKSEVVIKIGNEVEVKNPNTASNKYIIILIILVLVIVGFTLVMTKYGNKFEQLKQTNIKLVILFVAIALILYLGYSYAIEAINISVNSTVEVEKKIDRKARLARSCASDSYLNDGSGFCLDWTKYVDYYYAPAPSSLEDKVVVPYFTDNSDKTKIKSIVLLTATSNVMADSYTYNNINYELVDTYDVSDIQNGEIILGVYVDSKEEDYLLIIGQYSGVLAPVDGSSLFSGVNMHVSNLFTLPTEANLTHLDVFDTKNMSNMFYGVNFGKLDLSMWNTMNVENTAFMFSNSNFSSLDLVGFSTNNVVDMSSMFENTRVDAIDLSTFDTSNVTSVASMFRYLTATEIDGLNKFNTSKVTDMSYMFQYSSAVDLDLSSFDTSNVVDMGCMFQYSMAKSINVSSFDTSNVNSLSYMFSGINLDYLNINNFSLQSTDNLGGLFADSKIKKLDISSLNTSNIKSMTSMFAGSKIESLDLSKLDTSNVTNMSSMFSGSNIKDLDLSNFNTANLTDACYMFYGVTMDTLDLTSFDTTNLTDYSYMFAGSNIKKLDFSNIYINNTNKRAFDFNSMFYNYGKNVDNPEIYLNNFAVPKTYMIASVFSNFNSNLKVYTNSDAKKWFQKVSVIPDDNFVIIGS